MKKTERRKELFAYLAEHDSLEVEEAVRIFGASPATVRRDFSHLSREGVVTRTRGGIRRTPDFGNQPPPLALRGAWYPEEKRRLAECAARELAGVKSLFLDGGSTTAQLGWFLNDPEQTVVTNSLAFCAILLERFPNGGGPQVFLTGGRFHPESGLLLGSNAEKETGGYHPDAAVLSVRGLDESAIYNNNELIAGIGRTMIANSVRTVVLADHSKIGHAATHRVCVLSKISLLVTVRTEENSAVLDRIASSACGPKVVCC